MVVRSRSAMFVLTGIKSSLTFCRFGVCPYLQVWCECCRTADDDGERMMACDMCGIWKHTRCCGIADDDVEPPAFLCPDCGTAAAAAEAARQPKLLNVAGRGRKARQQVAAGGEAAAVAATAAAIAGGEGDSEGAVKKRSGGAAKKLTADKKTS